ncbi:MAG TPA: TonB-dependent siderophore receptor [Burkholderiales bacterium]|nr:TonB-dependent siderophore receptor [Burkholderiales bacterium]
MQYRLNRTPIAAAVAALFSSFTPGLAFAQATGSEATLPEVKVQETAPTDDFAPGLSNVGGKVPTPVRDIPQTVNIINRAVMESQGATSLSDALRGVPGITMGAAEGGTIGNNINLRGFSARTDIYLDGMRDRGQYYRDVYSLDQIEVLKGPSSMLFGRGSTGGVVNQVSKVPSLTPLNQATISVGTQPSMRTTADLNQPLSDTSAFHISAMAQDVNSTRDVMDYKDYGIAPSLRFGINTPTTVTLSAMINHNRDMPDYGLPPVNGAPANVNHKTLYGLTDDRTIQDVDEFTAKVVHKITPETTIQNQSRYANYKIDARESGPNSIGTVTGGVYTAFAATNLGNTTSLPLSQLFFALGSHDRVITDNSFYNQTDLITNYQTGGVRHDLIFGLELGDERNNQANSSRNVGTNNYFYVLPLVNPPYLTGAGLPSTPGNIVQASATTLAPYFNDTMTLSKQWKLIAGLRHDVYKANLSNSINLPPSASQTVNFNSVRTGLLYQPTDVQTYYASYGTSFNPSLEALTLTSGQQSLDPETNKSYEAGSKWDLLNGNLSVTSALFQVTKNNARAQISAGVYEDIGEVRVRGFEAGVAGRIRSDWQVLAGYTYLDARIVNAGPFDAASGSAPGNTLANTPKNSASVWTTCNVTHEWEAGTGLVYMSDRYVSNNNAVLAPDYLRWDATVAFHQPKYDIRLNLFNIANRLNYDALIPSDKGRSVPGIARTALLTYTQRF